MKEEIREILSLINNNGYEAYIIGGYVRDKLLSINSLDIDICTSAKYDALKKILPALKYIDLFSSTLNINNLNIQITTYRIEKDYNGRKPLHIEYTPFFEEDIKRRDFTINSIAMDKDGKLFDLYNGISDLNNRIIKTIGNSDMKIKEDHLRILRAIRFATILNFTFDDNLDSSIKKYGYLINDLSIYRKREELDKILSNGNYHYGLNLIKKYDLSKYLGIRNLNNIKYCHNLIGMYYMLDIEPIYLTNKELKIYNMLKKYDNKILSKYDLFCLGLEKIKIIDSVFNSNYVNIYNNLVIKSEKELKIDYNNIKENFSDIKKDIIINILDGKLENDYDKINDFINNK